MLYQLFWLFLAFSFLGWCLEVAATAVRLGQYRDRGVLHGPLCLVYGITGCLITIALRELSGGWFFLFLFSALYATVVEWIAGHLLEHYSHTRWWDYSDQPFNLNGYICLTSSLAWGAFSILLVRFLHPPVEDLVLRLPAFLVDPLAFLLTIAVTVDAVRSFQAAMDLREVLTRLTEENEDLRRLAKRVEVISAFAEEDLRRFRERTEVERLLRQERWEDTRRQIKEAYAKGARRRQAQLEESLRRRTDAKLTALANIQEALEAYRDRLAAARDLTEESLEADRKSVV